jgi:hypothetical protein
MKAYIVSDRNDYDPSVLVFAETASQAKSKAKGREELDGVEYVDLSARRAKYADGYENASERDLMILNIQNGWWYEIGGTRI